MRFREVFYPKWESVNSMSAKNSEQFRSVVRNGLCNRCGSCVGLSNGQIRFDNKEGRYLPRIVGSPDEETMKLVLSACSGRAFNFPAQRERLFGDTPSHVYTGAFRSIHIGYAENQQIRSQAASGGILSAMLIYLLRNKHIAGAVVLGMSKEKPWLTAPSRMHCMASPSSQYMSSLRLTSFNTAI